MQMGTRFLTEPYVENGHDSAFKTLCNIGIKDITDKLLLVFYTNYYEETDLPILGEIEPTKQLHAHEFHRSVIVIHYLRKLNFKIISNHIFIFYFDQFHNCYRSAG